MDKIATLILVIAMAAVANGSQKELTKAYCCPANLTCKATKDYSCLLNKSPIQHYAIHSSTGVRCTVCPVCFEDCNGYVYPGSEGRYCIHKTLDLKGDAGKCCPRTDFSACDSTPCRSDYARYDIYESKFSDTAWCPLCPVCECPMWDTQMIRLPSTNRYTCIKYDHEH